MPGFDAVPRDACGQAVWESAHELFFVRAVRGLSARLYLHALAAVLATALIAAADAAVPLHEQLVEAGSRAFQTSLSTLWRGSDDLRFKTTYAGGTVLDGFICSDLIDIGGYSSLAPFGCITETSGILDGAGIAGFGGWMCRVHARVMCSSDTVFPHPMPSWCISTSRREQSRFKVCKSTDDARKAPVLIGGRGIDSRSDQQQPLHCISSSAPQCPAL